MASLKMSTNPFFLCCNVEVVGNPVGVLWSNVLETSAHVDNIDYVHVSLSTCVNFCAFQGSLCFSKHFLSNANFVGGLEPDM